MSEVEELRMQLAEAQEENKALRAVIGRRKRREAYPDALLERFPLVVEAVGAKPVLKSQHEYFLHDWFTQKLSVIIRSAVFSDTARLGRGKGRSYIAVQEMDDEEHKLWLDMVERMLADLEDGAASRREMLERRNDDGSEPETAAV